jgi:hypothetical protein
MRSDSKIALLATFVFLCWIATISTVYSSACVDSGNCDHRSGTVTNPGQCSQGGGGTCSEEPGAQVSCSCQNSPIGGQTHLCYCEAS